MKQEKWWYNWLILIVGILLFFINLGTNTVDIMEARNFVTVREMLQSGDWLQPTMNGTLRLAKPPLPTWITATFANLFDLKGLFFLRLPAALMSLCLLFSMSALVKRLTNDKLLALLSAVSLSGMLYVILQGRRGTWDIYTHSFMLAAIVQFIAIFQSGQSLKRGIWGGILLGASFLSKGPVALYTVFLPFMIAFFLYQRPLVKPKQIIAMVTYFIIGGLISASWFAYIHLVWGDEAQQVLGKEVQNWISYNVRPFWYYLKDYPVHSGFWTAILAMGLLTTYTWQKSAKKRIYTLFWLWTVLSLVLLSIVPEKKVRYLLPTFLPAAFLVASYFYYLIVDFDRNNRKLDRIVFRIHWGLFALVTLTLPIAIYFLFYQKGLMDWHVLGVVIVTASICLLLFLKALQKYKRHYFLVGAVGLLSSAITFVLPHTDKAGNSEYNSIEAIQGIRKLDDLPCYALETTRIELVWFVGRKIKEIRTFDGFQPPYLLLTNKPPKDYPIVQSFTLIGHYDNNSKSKGHKHYEQGLSKYVSVVNRK